jgi:small GTP-binding protein domain
MLKIAFAGNPNVGKTALINEIAGSKLKVGNWPGVTVEKKEAQFTYENEEIFLIDLPGVYSLSPYSNEEIITRDYIINENPDLIINVVDATNLERNLYLTALLKELGKPMIIALNLYDEFKKLDYKLDEKQFEEFFGLNIVKTSARTREGLEDLLKKAISMSKEKETPNFKLHFNTAIDKEVEDIKNEILKKKSLNLFLQNLV